MLRRQPGMMDQSSITITILPDKTKHKNISPPSQQQLTASTTAAPLLLSRRDTKPILQHRPSKLIESTVIQQQQHQSLLTSLVGEWAKDGSPIQKLGAMLQTPFFDTTIVASTLQGGAAGGCINIDYSSLLCYDSSSIFREYYSFPLLNHPTVHQGYTSNALFVKPTLSSHPLQTRKTKLVMDIHQKGDEKQHQHQNDVWSTFCTTTGVLHSFGF